MHEGMLSFECASPPPVPRPTALSVSGADMGLPAATIISEGTAAAVEWLDASLEASAEAWGTKFIVYNESDYKTEDNEMSAWKGAMQLLVEQAPKNLK